MKIKIGFISDIHNKQNQWEMNMFERGYINQLEHCDIIAFTGDMTMGGRENEIEQFLKWFNEFIPTSQKVAIGGNHDFFLDTEWYARTAKGAVRHNRDNAFREDIENLLKKYPNVNYLNDSSIELMGVKFWGSPITPWFHDWAFNRFRGPDIQKHWDNIPNDTDVLLVHGPPYGLGDLLAPKFRRYDEDPNVGCQNLLAKVLEVNPKICAYGHIHEGYGTYQHNDVDTIFVNCSVLDENYQPINKPIILEVEV
jgi:Icc-related predicted phosphoesterase